MTKHVEARIEDRFEVSPLPPIAPDGGFAPQRRSLPLLDPPRICEAGPCRNYHRLVVVMAAERPMAVSVPVVDGGEALVGLPGVSVIRDGVATYVAPAPVYTETVRACYPAPGVEMAIDAPLLECSRWDPIKEDDKLPRTSWRSIAPRAFWQSAAGVEFTRRMADWKAARARAEHDDARVQDVINRNTKGPDQ